MNTDSVFHEGELFLQRLIGRENVESAQERGKQAILSHLSLESQQFVQNRNMAFISSYKAESSEVWCSVVFAGTKSVRARPKSSNSNQVTHSPSWNCCRIGPSRVSNKRHDLSPIAECMDPSTVRLLSLPMVDDPTWSNLKKCGWISVSFIEFETKRRLRTNGILLQDASETDGIVYKILESFTTCPKYIQQRVRSLTTSRIPEKAVFGDHTDLTDEMIHVITSADTFFIATVSPTHGADCSHRGGQSGFVRVFEKNVLVWGDYPGKNMFQTLGNTIENQNIGLLFMDFENGDILQLSGSLKLELLENQSGLDHSTRNCVFRVGKWKWTKTLSPFTWKLVAPSSHNPILLDSQVKVNGHTVIVKSASSAPFRTFCLKLQKFIRIEPGQYCTFALTINNQYYQRSWTVTSATHVPFPESSDESLLETNYIEISVKLNPDGVVSKWLHCAPLGTRFDLLGCEGGFTLAPSREILDIHKIKTDSKQKKWKLLYLTGGIGLTPMISMIRGLFKTFEEMYWIILNRILFRKVKEVISYTLCTKVIVQQIYSI
jgi:hypothetical protein